MTTARMLSLLWISLTCLTGDPPPPLTAEFLALTPAVVRSGDAVELEWLVTGAEGVAVETDAGWQAVPPVGKLWVRSKATRGYALVAWSADGEAVWCQLGVLVE